jgi:ATP-dependent Lon protease
VSSILQMLKLPDGTVKVLVEGVQRAHTQSVSDAGEHFVAEVLPVEPAGEPTRGRGPAPRGDPAVRPVRQAQQEDPAGDPDLDRRHRRSGPPGRHHRRAPAAQARSQAGGAGPVRRGQRLEKLLEQLEHEVDILQVEKRIRGRVKRQMEKSQREYYLNEQVKAIQKELGDGEEGADLEELEKKITAARMPKEARKKAEAELKKLKLMSPMSAEATVVRNYIDTLVGLPWSKKTKIKHDLAWPRRCSTRTTTAWRRSRTASSNTSPCSSAWTRSRRPSCAWWAPGRGQDLAGPVRGRATGRKFVRMALGGVRDEAEIRGHRRTYIGSMPGKVLQSLTKVGTRNPLFLLDEIDKLGMDFRGDPSSALLEVLDPEQNHTFGDHYIEVDFDLSDVMFVATSNSMNIPPALLDRMEVIRLSGYTEDEKVNIAQKYLLPKQIKNNGVKDDELEVTEGAIRDIIRYYTREAGVRSLEREISKICRKVVKGCCSRPTPTRWW